MRRNFTCVGLFVVCVACLMVATARRGTADDPGGNPNLTWDETTRAPTETNGTCNSQDYCITPFCYTWDHDYNGTTWHSFLANQRYGHGDCNGTGSGKYSCYATLKCADVYLYSGTLCTGTKSTDTVPIYKKDACKIQ